MHTHRQPNLKRGYTLVEVLTAAVVMGVSLAAAVSMSSTVLLQEELSWRVSVGLNHQENAARLFQLGLDGPEIVSMMPVNNVMDEILVEIVNNRHFTVTSTAPVTNPLVGGLESAALSSTIKNRNSAPTPGSSNSAEVYRQSIR